MRDRIISIRYSYLMLPALAVALTTFFSSQVNACSCTTPSIREAFGRADAVFTGKAIEGSEKREEVTSSGKKIIRLGGLVRFTVEQAFSGVKGGEVKVITWDGAACGFDDFTQGERYLIYGEGNENQGFRVWMCSRSHHISYAAEDLKVLSTLSPKTCGVRLYGAVGRFGINWAKGEEYVAVGIPNITITATDAQGQTLKAVTYGSGRYEIEGVKADVEYTVQAHLPDYFQNGPAAPQKVRIKTCAWARVDFTAIYDGAISGQVTGPDGAPIHKADVVLAPFDAKELRINTQVGVAVSDAQGRFELNGVAPGAYLLGVNITEAPEKDCPYPPTWYPNATQRQVASVIKVGPGQKLKGYDLKVSGKLAEKTIEGDVFWPDGRPVVGAFIHLSPAAQPGQGSGGLALIHTDSRGHFSIFGFEGIAYYVVASAQKSPLYPPTMGWVYAEPPLVEIKQGNITGLKLVLTLDEGAFDDFFKKKREQ